MPFSSYTYIVGYLPIVCLIFLYLRRIRNDWSLIWLVAASAAFYMFWHPRDLTIVGVSFCGNFLGARWIMTSRRPRRAVSFAVSINLLLLAYFKYGSFLLAPLSARLAANIQVELPLGISFFTFTQIAYLVDCYHGSLKPAQHRWLYYLTFASFFPHLIAGPIIHNKDFLPQLSRTFRPNLTGSIRTGMVLFTIGLFKKTVIADALGKIADPIFNAADAGFGPECSQAWLGSLSYALQIYFDFSGYSDMAVASALFLGFRIPFNFDSPYKSASIIDFWRRWHITLSNFLRDYLYIPLGGNRRGEARRYANIFITMLLGGIWHGAGTNFMIWGALHGGFIIINHLWRDLGGAPPGAGASRSPWHLSCRIITMLCVLLAWIFFRAHTIAGAINLLVGISAVRALAIPSFLAKNNILIGIGMLIVTFAPSSRTIHDRMMLDRPIPFWGWLLAGAGFAIAFVAVSADSPFLYFQF